MHEVAASHGARSSTALYGFVAWIAIHVSFSIFLLWAYTPDGVLVSLGVTYFPDKHWALALPCWTLVSLLAAVVLYATYNAMHHPDLESLSNIVDEYTRVPDERDLGGACFHLAVFLASVDGRSSVCLRGVSQCGPTMTSCRRASTCRLRLSVESSTCSSTKAEALPSAAAAAASRAWHMGPPVERSARRGRGRVLRSGGGRSILLLIRCPHDVILAWPICRVVFYLYVSLAAREEISIEI